MRLPEETIRRLGPLFPGLDLRSIDFIIAEPQRVAACRCCPHAYVKAGSSPEPGLIFIHPDFWAPSTLQGLKLIAHELYHQAQQQATPEFDAIYDAMAGEIDRRGLPPWRHPLETPAYEVERVLEALWQ